MIDWIEHEQANDPEFAESLREIQARVRRVEADIPRLIVDAIADRMKP